MTVDLLFFDLMRYLSLGDITATTKGQGKSDTGPL